MTSQTDLGKILSKHMSEEVTKVFDTNFDVRGVPLFYKESSVLGTSHGVMYIHPNYVATQTTKGLVSEQELLNAFEHAEQHFTDHPKDNQFTYDSFVFHTYDTHPYVIYCLPFGCVYYKDLDHE